jgi:hypothetical protein
MQGPPVRAAIGGHLAGGPDIVPAYVLVVSKSESSRIRDKRHGVRLGECERLLERHLRSRVLVWGRCGQANAYRTPTTRLAKSPDDIATTTPSYTLLRANARVNYRCGFLS